MLNFSPLTKSPFALTVTRWAAALWLETGRVAVFSKLLISSPYDFQTLLRHVLCLPRTVLIPPRSDKLISQSDVSVRIAVCFQMWQNAASTCRDGGDERLMASLCPPRRTPETLLGLVSLFLCLSLSLPLIPPSPSSLFFPLCSSPSLCHPIRRASLCSRYGH